MSKPNPEKGGDQQANKILRLDSHVVSGRLATRCGFCTEADEQHTVPEERKRRYTESTVNMVTLLGRVGNDPVVLGNEQDDSYAVKFSLATDAGRSGHRLWHTIIVKNKSHRNFVQNNICSGDRVFVHGHLSYVQSKELKNIVRIISNDVYLIQRSQKNFQEKQQLREVEEDINETVMEETASVKEK